MNGPKDSRDLVPEDRRLEQIEELAKHLYEAKHGEGRWRGQNFTSVNVAYRKKAEEALAAIEGPYAERLKEVERQRDEDRKKLIAEGRAEVEKHEARADQHYCDLQEAEVKLGEAEAALAEREQVVRERLLGDAAREANYKASAELIKSHATFLSEEQWAIYEATVRAALTQPSSNPPQQDRETAEELLSRLRVQVRGGQRHSEEKAAELLDTSTGGPDRPEARHWEGRADALREVAFLLGNPAPTQPEADPEVPKGDPLQALRDAEIQRPGKVFVWHDATETTGDWLGGEEVNRRIRELVAACERVEVEREEARQGEDEFKAHATDPEVPGITGHEIEEVGDALVADPEVPRCEGSGTIPRDARNPRGFTTTCPGCPDCQSAPVLLGEERRCELPPAGWRCTRGAGHDGPCAAIPVDEGSDRLEAATAAARAWMVDHDLEGYWFASLAADVLAAADRVTVSDEVVRELTKQIVEGSDGEVISLPYQVVKDALTDVLRHPGSNQPASESPGDSGVEIDGAVELLAERLFRFHAINTGAVTRWPDTAEGTRNGWRQDARSHLEAIRHLLTQPVPGNSGGLQRYRVEATSAASTQPPSPQAEVQDCEQVAERLARVLAERDGWEWDEDGTSLTRQMMLDQAQSILKAIQPDRSPSVAPEQVDTGEAFEDGGEDAEQAAEDTRKGTGKQPPAEPQETAVEKLAMKFWQLRTLGENLPSWEELTDEERASKLANARSFLTDLTLAPAEPQGDVVQVLAKRYFARSTGRSVLDFDDSLYVEARQDSLSAARADLALITPLLALEVKGRLAKHIERQAEAVLAKAKEAFAADEAVRARRLEDDAAVMRNDAAHCRGAALDTPAPSEPEEGSK